MAGLDGSIQGQFALDVQGLLVAPSYTPEGVEALVDRAKQAPASPVAALKLLRFKAETGGFIVLVDDMFEILGHHFLRCVWQVLRHEKLPPGASLGHPWGGI